jgi:hypothetical protein
MARTSHDIERIFKLQKQIHVLSSWLLQKLDGQASELANKEQRILLALSNGDLARHDLFISRAADRLKAILAELGELTEARDKVQTEYVRQRMMLKVMEQRLAKMRGDEQRKAEDRELTDLLEHHLRRSA